MNIHCDGCKKKVKKLLQKIEGILSRPRSEVLSFKFIYMKGYLLLKIRSNREAQSHDNELYWALEPKWDYMLPVYLPE